MNGLTVRQARVLEYLRRYVLRNGFPPTIREMREAFGLRSNRGVVDHLRALERKGCIRRVPGGSRAIEILAEAGPGGDRGTRTAVYPVAGSIAAGKPEPPADEPARSFALDEGLFPERGDFLLEVRGESMIGEHIVPGDLVVVGKGRAVESGDLVVALVDGEATVKRYVRKGPRIVLEPANPAYAPIVLSRASCGGASIVGKVVGVIRRYPKGRRAFSR